MSIPTYPTYLDMDMIHSHFFPQLIRQSVRKKTAFSTTIYTPITKSRHAGLPWNALIDKILLHHPRFSAPSDKARSPDDKTGNIQYRGHPKLIIGPSLLKGLYWTELCRYRQFRPMLIWTWYIHTFLLSSFDRQYEKTRHSRLLFP